MQEKRKLQYHQTGSELLLSAEWTQEAVTQHMANPEFSRQFIGLRVVLFWAF